MATGTRKTGEFCWINMLTPQPAGRARSSASCSVGRTPRCRAWATRVQVGGRDIGGLFDLEGPNTPKGTPPLIGVMVKVESADATCEKVTSLGGKARPAFDIMDQGRMAVCFDPRGRGPLFFALHQPEPSVISSRASGHRGRISPGRRAFIENVVAHDRSVIYSRTRIWVRARPSARPCSERTPRWYPVAQGDDQSRILGHGNELRGTDHAPRWVARCQRTRKPPRR